MFGHRIIMNRREEPWWCDDPATGRKELLEAGQDGELACTIGASAGTSGVSAVREALEDDAPAVEAVWEAVAAEGEWIGTELPLRAGWQDLFRRAVASPAQAWMVAEVASDVVGAVFVQEERGLAHVGMAILGGHRGMGLGRLLLGAAIQWSVDHRCHKVTLEVWPHNERARRLYRSAGFEDEAYFKRHYRRQSGALWDAVGMGLVLDRTSPTRP